MVNLQNMSNEQEVESIKTEKQKEDKINMMEEWFNAIQSQMQWLIGTLGTCTKQVKIHSQNICFIAKYTSN